MRLFLFYYISLNNCSAYNYAIYKMTGMFNVTCQPLLIHTHRIPISNLYQSLVSIVNSEEEFDTSVELLYLIGRHRVRFATFIAAYLP